ncbi:hypothetical protein NE579_15460 [Intestinimonas massiliensis]|uniref:Uncharacterized protein n=1 Tax=Intestinimonas massiliensis (ex Afouda et al. 2020) TaxID=1673721 RepID=A0AAW5JV44_9FIRM|nr:hypothetical protein [Intestinimonas massiliensis (ex Afouda et al. 2020)]MCQ4771834.1 hypothetical protein [Intestinimonas massiliensis (ex Afouda et al. 2020)]
MLELVFFMASMLLLPLVPFIFGGALILCACMSFADHPHKSAPPA